MTSNIGARQVKDFGAGVGFQTSAREKNMDQHTKSVIESALKRTFTPEFLNRIDDVIIFNQLEQEHIHSIIDIALKDVLGRLEKLGYKLELSQAAKDFLSDKGYDPQFGARPLHRAIQKYLEDPLAEQILGGDFKEGSTLKVDFKEKEEELIIKEKKSRKKATSKEKEAGTDSK